MRAPIPARLLLLALICLVAAAPARRGIRVWGRASPTTQADDHPASPTGFVRCRHPTRTPTRSAGFGRYAPSAWTGCGSLAAVIWRRSCGLRCARQRPPPPPSAWSGTARSIGQSDRHQRGSPPCAPAGSARRAAPRVPPASCMNEFLHPTGLPYQQADVLTCAR
jgi:hypothetical protein